MRWLRKTQRATKRNRWLIEKDDRLRRRFVGRRAPGLHSSTLHFTTLLSDYGSVMEVCLTDLISTHSLKQTSGMSTMTVKPWSVSSFCIHLPQSRPKASIYTSSGPEFRASTILSAIITNSYLDSKAGTSPPPNLALIPLQAVGSLKISGSWKAAMSVAKRQLSAEPMESSTENRASLRASCIFDYWRAEGISGLTGRDPTLSAGLRQSAERPQEPVSYLQEAASLGGHGAIEDRPVTCTGAPHARISSSWRSFSDIYYSTNINRINIKLI